MDFWKYSPLDMALQITCMDFYKFFKYLREHEFLDCAWMKSTKEESAPNILRLIRRFNNGAEWVAAEVLQGETAELRVARAEKLIDIADELLRLHNYSSMMMIVSGFMSTPVYRLKTLWEDISSKHFKKLQNMRTILDATGNHGNYRKHFASVPSPKLPFIGLYLTDLVYLQEVCVLVKVLCL
jgi:RasGEF domain